MIFVVVHRGDEDLRLFRFTGNRWKCEHRYQVATGRHGLETPAGLRWVKDKSRHPDYRYPGPPSDWVPEELQGKVIKFGDPDNPIAARWIGLGDGIGIHGTFDDASIGTHASHGCIRMHQSDVIELFDLVPLNPPTPVFIY